MENIRNKIESTIHSMDGLIQAEVPPFFHTRVQAKLEKKIAFQQHTSMLIRKPVWLIASLTILLAANIFLVTQKLGSRASIHTGTPEAATLQEFASTYGLNTSTGY